MAKILILGNFELALEGAEGRPLSEAVVRAKERRILRFLKKLAEEEPGLTGTVESFEFEGFTYNTPGAENPNDYYYNKYSAEDSARPGPNAG
jgi:hypothetical protein